MKTSTFKEGERETGRERKYWPVTRLLDRKEIISKHSSHFTIHLFCFVFRILLNRDKYVIINTNIVYMFIVETG